MKTFALLVAAVAAFATPPAEAVEQLTATKRIRVVNPASGNRVVSYKAITTGGANTIVGDPTATGASMHVRLTAGGQQCFLMPAAGWTGSGSIFKYRESTPTLRVKAVLKESPSGLFRLVFKARGTAITVSPGNPTTTYDANFRIAGGDNYCSGGPQTGATTVANTATAYVIANDPPPGTCQLSVCSPSGAFLDPSLESLF